MKKLLAAFACLLALMLCVCACAEGHTGEMKLEELVIEAVYTVEPVETEDPEAAAPAIKTAAEDPAVINDYVITPDGYLVLTLEDEKLYAVGIMSAFVAEDQIGENDSVEIDEVTYALLSGCEEKENGDFVVTLNADETEYLLGTMAQPGDSYVAKVSRKKAAAEEEVTTETATLNTTYIDKDSGDVIKTVSETWTNSSNGDYSYVSETVDYVHGGETTREETTFVTNADGTTTNTYASTETDSDGNVTDAYSSVETADADGNVIYKEVKTWDATEVTESEYVDGKLVSERIINTDPEGTYDVTNEYTYDEEGRVVSVVTKDTATGEAQYGMDYTYETAEDGTVTETSVYHDADGNVIETVVTTTGAIDLAGTEATITEVIEKDEDGNVTRTDVTVEYSMPCEDGNTVDVNLYTVKDENDNVTFEQVQHTTYNSDGEQVLYEAAGTYPGGGTYYAYTDDVTVDGNTVTITERRQEDEYYGEQSDGQGSEWTRTTVEEDGKTVSEVTVETEYNITGGSSGTQEVLKVTTTTVTYDYSDDENRTATVETKYDDYGAK